MRIRIINGALAMNSRLKTHLDRRLDYALSSFRSRLGSVVVRLSNGEASHPDAPLVRCEIEAVMRPRSVSVTESGKDLFVAVENAAHRLKSSVARAFARQREWSEAMPAPRPLRAARKGRK